MNGIHDLGGMHGFGPVVPERDEPVFHAPWERRVFALALAMGFTGTWSLDASRSARESLPPVDYLTSTYYEIWLKALEAQLESHGLATRPEMANGRVEDAPKPVKRVLRADAVTPLFEAGFPSKRPPAAPARFTVGDSVMTRTMNPAGHTRLPRYARGRRGSIGGVHGAFVFPDASATGEDAPPQRLYSVTIDAEAIWGEDASDRTSITLALFESYLLPQGDAQ